MAEKKDTHYAEHIDHVQATHPDPWPGIQGRSEDHDDDLPTGTRRDQQAGVTEAQRKLEKEMHEGKEPVRE